MCANSFRALASGWILVITVVCTAVGYGEGGSAPSPSLSQNQSPSTDYQFSFDYLGQTGITGDNVSALETTTGGIRAYYIKPRMGVVSAVSTSGRGFTEEPGVRHACCTGTLRVIKTSGGFRLYNAAPAAGSFGASAITSAFSPDGVTFTPEPGVRMSASTMDAPGVSTATIVPIADDRLRMYFSTHGKGDPNVGLRTEIVYSATSSDGLDWTLDEGARTGPGTAVPASAFHPSALLNPDGSVTLFFFRNRTESIHYATARDGLTFGPDEQIVLPGHQQNDPDVLALTDGRILLFTARGSGPLGPGGGSPATVYDVTTVTRTDASAAAVFARTNQAAASARSNESSAIRVLTDQVVDALSPVSLPRSHSVRERVFRAEENFRLGAIAASTNPRLSRP